MILCWKNKQALGQEYNFFFLWSGVSQQNSPLQKGRDTQTAVEFKKGGLNGLNQAMLVAGAAV